jgi:hypothetical protein
VEAARGCIQYIRYIEALQQQVIVRIVRNGLDAELLEPLDAFWNVSGGSDARSSGC